MKEMKGEDDLKGVLRGCLRDLGGGFLDFSALDAGRADADALAGAFDHGVDLLQVDIQRRLLTLWA